MAHDLGGCCPFAGLGVVFLSVAVLHHLLQDHLVLVVTLIVRTGLARHRLPDPAVLHDRFAVLLEREESLRRPVCEAVIRICTARIWGNAPGRSWSCKCAGCRTRSRPGRRVCTWPRARPACRRTPAAPRRWRIVSLATCPHEHDNHRDACTQESSCGLRGGLLDLDGMRGAVARGAGAPGRDTLVLFAKHALCGAEAAAVAQRLGACRGVAPAERAVLPI